ncbi:MAG: fumarate hydratase [Candidatus Cloacimonadota bacterium]|nr:MAG: fumarate hydratase [Candidatus Cloacimonadota bacterium]
MKEIEASKITEAVKKLVMDANYFIGDDVKKAIEDAIEKETSPTAKEILNMILENHKISREEQLPMCQDTGVAVFFIELGQDVHIVGEGYEDAINEGVKQGYTEGYLRKSMVGDPIIERKNTGDNTPAVIHTRIVPGDKIHILVAPKGGGSENMSEVRMMKAADGIEGVKDFVVERVKKSGGNPCPPIVVGVGLGGNFEMSAILSKKSLTRNFGQRNPDPKFSEVEVELLKRINKLGIGPMGLGGKTTALEVFIEYIPCHIASMPVAVNINCHAARHKEITL